MELIIPHQIMINNKIKFTGSEKGICSKSTHCGDAWCRRVYFLRKSILVNDTDVILKLSCWLIFRRASSPIPQICSPLSVSAVVVYILPSHLPRLLLGIYFPYVSSCCLWGKLHNSLLLLFVYIAKDYGKNMWFDKSYKSQRKSQNIPILLALDFSEL